MDTIAVTISGGLGVGGNIYVGSTTNSTSINTGSVVIAGGIGISQNTNIGGNVKITASTSSISTTTGALTVSGGVGISQNANIGGNVTIIGLTNCSGGFLTSSYTIQTNNTLLPNPNLHNSYIYFKNTTNAINIGQILPATILNTTSTIILNNLSTSPQTINTSSTNIFYGCGYDGNSSISLINFNSGIFCLSSFNNGSSVETGLKIIIS